MMKISEIFDVFAANADGSHFIASVCIFTAPQMDHNARSFQTELRLAPVLVSLALLISLKRACAVREQRVETVCSALASDLGSGHLFKCAHA